MIRDGRPDSCGAVGGPPRRASSRRARKPNEIKEKGTNNQDEPRSTRTETRKINNTRPRQENQDQQSKIEYGTHLHQPRGDASDAAIRGAASRSDRCGWHVGAVLKAGVYSPGRGLVVGRPGRRRGKGWQKRATRRGDSRGDRVGDRDGYPSGQPTRRRGVSGCPGAALSGATLRATGAGSVDHGHNSKEVMDVGHTNLGARVSGR